MRRFRLKRVTSILVGLGLQATPAGDDWQVTVPSYRFDIDVEDALVEEIARIYGYDEIPEITATGDTPLARVPEAITDLDLVANTLVARDYQEIVTYSFIDEKTDEQITGSASALVLSNPISSEMSVMRGSIWPGLLTSAAANLARQQDRVRLFEIGKTFHGTLDEPREVVRVSGIATGSALDEQWGARALAVDFFDVKADLEALFEMTGARDQFSFTPVEHGVLQPGQSASILRDGKRVGLLGKLHPKLAGLFDIGKDAFLFELDAERCFAADIPVADVISKYPAIRRDIASDGGRERCLPVS